MSAFPAGLKNRVVIELDPWNEYTDCCTPLGDLDEAFGYARADFGFNKQVSLASPQHQPLLLGVQKFGEYSIILFERKGNTAAYVVEESYDNAIRELAKNGYEFVEIVPQRNQVRKALNLSHYTPLPRP
jgi:hypothetical protein